MVLAKYGENTELDEDASGNTVIRNTATGTEVLLADFVDIVGSFGSAANRIDGESFFDQLNANSVETSTVIDSDDATSYDVGDDLASGAFSDGDNDGTYTLPNPGDGIEVGAVNTDSAGVTNQLDAGSVNTENIANKYHYAGGYAGSDADTRLSNSLSAASNGDVIFLETKDYGNTTLNKKVKLIGAKERTEWRDTTLDIQANNVSLEGISIAGSGKLAVNGKDMSYYDGRVFGSVTVSNDVCLLYGLGGEGSVTFESGTADGSISAVSGSLSITDNGSNTTPPDN